MEHDHMNTIECAFTARVASVTPLKTSAAGKPRAAFKAAVGQDDAVQWVRVALFGEIAQQLMPTLQKGDKVYVEGTLRLDRWKNDAGEERSGLSVAAWKCERLAQIGHNKPPRPRADHLAPGDDQHRGRDGFSLQRESDAGADLNQDIPF
jgi:single-strand DNA-binding protein